jgi:hypothetical protein
MSDILPADALKNKPLDFGRFKDLYEAHQPGVNEKLVVFIKHQADIYKQELETDVSIHLFLAGLSVIFSFSLAR